MIQAVPDIAVEGDDFPTQHLPCLSSPYRPSQGSCPDLPEAVYRTHPALKNISNNVQVTIGSEKVDTMVKIEHDFYSRHDNWSKEGWSGYAAASLDGIIIRYFLPDATVDQAKASM